MSKERQTVASRRAQSDRLLTMTEAAHLVGKTRQTISRWVHDGLIPVVRQPSGLFQIWQSDLDAIFATARSLHAAQEIRRAGNDDATR